MLLQHKIPRFGAVGAGGDALLMACLWKAGYAITDPGFSFYHPELRMFDPVSQEGRQLLYAFTEGLSGGCDDSCQVFYIALVFGLDARFFLQDLPL